MNYITVKLTEDQVRGLRHLLESNLSVQFGEENKPFIRRVLSKLDKSLATAKS